MYTYVSAKLGRFCTNLQNIWNNVAEIVLFRPAKINSTAELKVVKLLHLCYVCYSPLVIHSHPGNNIKIK